MATVNLSELEGRLLRPAEPGEFTAAELEGLPEPARRHLAQAIAPGAPLATSARLRMRGHIKVGRWLPFRAREVLDPHHGFVWAARAAGVIAGSDRYLDGVGAMDWKLLGLAAVAHGEGPDQVRSAAARAGAEGMWVPSALLPRFGVRWTAGGPDRVTVRHQLGETPVEVRYGLDGAGRVRWFVLDRWGDPEGTGTFGFRLDRGPTRGGGGPAEPSGQDAQHVVAGEDAHRPPEGWHAASGAGSTSKDRVRRSSLNGPKAPEEEAAMADLRTRYLGLELPSPLVASSSPLTGTLEGLGRLEAAGAGAVVLPSLFEEDLAEEAREVDALLATGATGAEARAGHPEQAGYGAGPAAYLSLVERAKARLSIPVIASLNGISRGGWVRNAARLEQAGADALELNLYYVSSSPAQSGSEVEWRYLDIVGAVRQAAGIPLAVKLSPYFSSVTNMAGQLVEAGVDGLVLFNRFYQPDLDVETLQVVPSLELSTSAELRLPVRWIAILYRRLGVSLAASTGVHTAEDVLKVLLAGADVATMTSALLRNGPDHLSHVEALLRDWLDRHGHESVDRVRGRLSQRSVPDPAAFEQANYLKVLASRSPR